MKVGDLVGGIKHSTYEGFCGIVLAFDGDHDPIIAWAGCEGSWEIGKCGDFRAGLRVVNAAR